MLKIQGQMKGSNMENRWASSEKTCLKMKSNEPESQNLKIGIGGAVKHGLVVSMKYILI